MRASARGYWATLFLFVLGAVCLFAGSGQVHAANGCTGNAIVCENQKPGSPQSEWDISGAGDPSIQGFATDISVDAGQQVDFKVKTDSTAYHLDIYRLGYYGGDGARKVATVTPSATLPQTQPDCLSDDTTGLVDCGNWAVSASWQVPADAVSGIYIAKLVRDDVASGGSHIAFVVRNDNSNSDLLFQTSDTTWQAYNRYGGNSLYTGSPDGRAYKVSYNRPFTTRDYAPEDWLFNAEYPMVRFLERNGYDVSYATGVDTARSGNLLLNHKTFLSVGHDEYWSGDQRANVEAARAAGVNLAFFSGNEGFWKTRWEPSTDSSATPFRTLVSYKETTANAKIDPVANTWTGTWRDPRPFNPEGPHPENALNGTIFMVNDGGGPSSIQVPAAEGKMRFWRNTDIASLPAGSSATLPAGTLGYEWDEDLDNGFRPAGLFDLSTATYDNQPVLQDYGSTYGSGTATHHMTEYRAPSGALVFGAGTVQWSWGLDDSHDRGSGTPTDSRMQQATVNLLADMGAQPSTLQSGLASATASTDTTAPSSTVTSPASGATIPAGKTVTISGTAADTGGVVGGVEVSIDGGNTWHPASGLDTWTYSWKPSQTGTATILTRAVDDSGNLEKPSAGTSVTVGSGSCPCSLWDPSVTPQTASDSDTGAVELGVKFHSDVDGYITGLRFYKGSENTGTHVGHLWTADGTQLAAATFTGESASGWQDVTLDSPVAITANTTYIASYHAPNGHYAVDASYFASSGVDSPPLHAGATGDVGGNGVYTYGPSGSFPTSTFNGSNYWVDVDFSQTVGADTTPPTVQSVTPASDASSVATNANVTATFSEPVTASSVTGNFELRDAGGALVPAQVNYDSATRTATLTPNAALSTSATYTATVKGGANGVADTSGNTLQADKTWSFTTAGPPPDEGPGGPVLVVAGSSNPFGRYYAEILRTEGLNEFKVTDLSRVTPSVLSNYDVVILGETPLTTDQMTMFSDWVQSGGNLIAMRPDKQLADLLGLTAGSGTLDNAYLKVDTSTSPGKGIVGQTIQFHGSADRYTLNGATAVATLYDTATSATPNPAVTLRSVGPNGGQAAAFTYDLARSIVYTRQGNPAWAGQERDGVDGIRSDDMFFPDWIDLSKVAIPQADEQQRLLANLIEQMNADRKPLPRFWYFPSNKKAVVVLTADDHGSGHPAARMDLLKSMDPANCSVADWQCVRSTEYVYASGPLTDSQVASYQSQGFEIGVHVNSGCTATWTTPQLEGIFDSELAGFASAYPSAVPQTTNRTHCIPWNNWLGEPTAELDHGIRLDTNYYYYPGSWLQDRPGLFTGSGMPMRFADTDGTMIDVYQAATQMTDESEQSYPTTINALLDKATGPEGYYGAFTANIHSDRDDTPAVDIVQSAQAHGVPVVSARQLLTWLDGRNSSTFDSQSWSGDTLTFGVTVGSGARNLDAMLPTHAATGTLSSLKANGSAVNFQRQTIKGVEYAVFPASATTYQAVYAGSTNTPPTAADDTYSTETGKALSVSAPGVLGNDSDPDSGDTLTAVKASDPQHGNLSLNSDGSFSYTPTAGYVGTDSFTYQASDGTAQSPAATVTITVTAAAAFTDTTTADFQAGTVGSNLYVGETGDGELILAPTVGAEFSGSSLPAGWSQTAWSSGGAATVGGGQLTVDGARANTDSLFDPGRVLEFKATFGSDPFQHVGFGTDFSDAPWAMFSTGGGSLPVGLYARSFAPGGSAVNTAIPGVLPTVPHDYRIEWRAGQIVYFVDGQQVASHTVAISSQMRPVASDFNPGGTAVTVDWLRMSPYQSSGSFDSRIFDAGSTVSWDTLDWQAQTPTGTTLAMSVRAGDTATPDGSWSAWTPVASSGGHAGVVGRYAQYRADLSSTNSDSTPELDQVSLTTAAAPSNHPPVAAGDAYLTAKNTTLNQAAPGVLANDTDADSDPLTAHLDTNVAHGTLNLAAGGSFTYTPDNGYTGQDSFTYHANDGTADSNTVTVRLTVTTGTSLPPGSALTAGQSITSPNGVYRLTMQGDGNLVEYDRGSVVWAAGTDPTGASAVMQGDGNFVVYDASNHALWASDTSGQAGATLLLGDTGVAVVSVDGATIWAPGTLSPGDRLLSGQSLLSPAGRYRLTMQGDGNLVEYNRTGTAVWASGTSTAGSRAVMQSDGNLVVYDGSNQPLWATNTSGQAGAYLRLQDTGQLTLESATGTALWAGPAELTADTSLTVGHSLNSPSGAFRLTLQSDGNLVEYDAGANVVWATGTSSGSKLIMQGDGNFVLYDAGDHALWASGTSGHAGATVTLLDTGQLVVAAPSGAPLWAGPGALLPDTRLNAGQSLSSPTGAYQLTMQVDGDLVLEHNSTVVWSSGTSSPGASALLQGDGNLVVYSSTSQALWATNTDGNPSSYLVLSDDGKLALLSPEGGTLWSAG